MKMIVEGPSSIPVGGKFQFLVLQNKCSVAVGAWNFVILVEASGTGRPSLVAVRMEYLFAYQFCLSNLRTFDGKPVSWRKEPFFLLTSSCGVLLKSVGESWCGWFYTSVCSYKLHALTVYLHSAFTVPPIRGSHLESSRTSVKERLCRNWLLSQKTSVSLTWCLTGF